MGTDHPVIWSHEQGRGRAWYTALGHTEASWSEQRFLAHVIGGIRWAAGTD
jgi:type 1 glutamine amidotransferase